MAGRESTPSEPELPDGDVPMPRSSPESPKPCECGAEKCPWSTLELKECGHEVIVPCKGCQKQPDVTVLCTTLVEPTNPSPCGHPVLVPCSLKDELIPNAVARHCTEICGATFVKEENGCGHICPGTCVLCRQGRFHVRCTSTCDRILICNHVCTEPCNQCCPPCPASCEVGCEHGRCKKTCGYPCEPCQEPCVWECPHLKCTKKCGEVCDRPPCNVWCPKILSCGHPCISFCGEPCPTLCMICDKDRLEAGLLHCKDTVEDTDRFILLQDCGHSIELSVMEGWMNVQDSEGEFCPKMCPLCKRTIYRCRRYNAVIHRIRVDTGRIQTKIYGDLTQIREFQKDFLCFMGEGSQLKEIRLKDMYEYLEEYLPMKKGHKGELNYLNLDYQKIRSLVYVTKIWLDIEKKFEQFVEDEMAKTHLNVMQHCYERVFAEIIDLDLPLRPFEYRDFHRQLERFHDLSQLYQRRCFKLNQGAELCRTREGRKAFEKCQDLAWLWAPYDEDLKAKFRAALAELDEIVKCTLKITEEERRSILRAIGLCSGRWFKCPNGHIYLITECGGATQTSFCNECGRVIGGINHRIVENNTLATEMDGALETAYPGAAGGLDEDQ